MTAPDWLTLHNGALKLGSDGKTWFVVFKNEPQYALNETPVAGKFGCTIRQTINGRRFESAGPYPSREAALDGGLDELRKSLGW